MFSLSYGHVLHCHAASAHRGNYVKSTITLESPKRAGGSIIWNVDVCCLLVVRAGACVAMTLSLCLISVLSPCALLPFYLSIVVPVPVAVLGAVVVITQDPAPALVAVTGCGSNGHTPAMCETHVFKNVVAFSKAHSPCGGNSENHSEGLGGSFSGRGRLAK